MIPPKPTSSNPTRRRFLQSSASAIGASMALQIPLVHASESSNQIINIAVIGCGGRGSGAVLNALGAASSSVYPEEGYHTEDASEGATIGQKDIQVKVLADLFENRLERCRSNLQRLGIDVPKSRCFLGFDAYEKALADPDVNYVICTTPPHFRPAHVKAAVDAGKNVFMEKPAAVDAPGVKLIMEAGRIAAEKGLGIAAGTQRRHTRSYQQTIQRLHAGEIGEIVYAKCYWNGGQIWVVPRQPEWTDTEWQIRNWNYFIWLSGDHIVEQHVHNLDVINWVLGTHPIKAVSGLGGRQSRTGTIHGNIFDHFAVEYEYPGGVTMFSQCRQINRCKNIVGEEVFGTQGRSNCEDQIWTADGKQWRYRGDDPPGFDLEHQNLIASIRAGTPINEAQAIAESTMTAILGREACYSGQEIRWDDAINSTTRLGPERYEFGPHEIAPVRKPGKYRFT